MPLDNVPLRANARHGDSEPRIAAEGVPTHRHTCARSERCAITFHCGGDRVSTAHCSSGLSRVSRSGPRVNTLTIGTRPGLSSGTAHRGCHGRVCVLRLRRNHHRWSSKESATLVSVESSCYSVSSACHHSSKTRAMVCMRSGNC